MSHALLRALWAEERDISRADVRQAVAEENGYDGTKLVATKRSARVQALYRQFSAEAEKLGITHIRDRRRAPLGSGPARLRGPRARCLQRSWPVEHSVTTNAQHRPAIAPNRPAIYHDDLGFPARCSEELQGQPARPAH